jgi:hypothetical protein
MVAGCSQCKALAAAFRLIANHDARAGRTSCGGSPIGAIVGDDQDDNFIGSLPVQLREGSDNHRLFVMRRDHHDYASIRAGLASSERREPCSQFNREKGGDDHNRRKDGGKCKNDCAQGPVRSVGI